MYCPDGQPDQVFYDKEKDFTNRIIKNNADNKRKLMQSWPEEKTYTRSTGNRHFRL